MEPPFRYDGPVSRLTAYAVKTYNDRHPELNSVLQLNTEEYYLSKYYQALGESEKIKDVIERGDKLNILQGYPQETRDPDLKLPRF